jgi:hypothetical protein
MSSRFYAFLAAIVTLLASGVLYHALARDSAQLDAAAERVAQVPTIVGDWHGHDEATDDGAFAQAGAKAYWMRVYVHQKTKASVLVILMCGRSGRMAVHTPEVCYGGAGFELQDAAKPCEFKNETGEKTSQFWTAHFVKKAGAPKHLRLYWAWNARGEWDASSSPRWQFRGEPFLYKLYVSRDISQAPNTAAQADAAAEFLRTFLPVLKQSLAGISEPDA